MAEAWDVIVVGARCAGATLATLLAERGLRTLLLEASSRGTDMPLSTHYIHAPGMAVLERMGLGQRVRDVTPPSRWMRLALDDAHLRAELPPEGAGYCVRRSTLDPWLQERAEEAGAELRVRHRVTRLVRVGERVAGVVASTPNGEVTLRAHLVIGADGVHSTLARLTQVEAYLINENPRACYKAYYPAPAAWTLDWDALIEHRGALMRYVFRCDGDLICLAYAAERESLATWGAAKRARLEEALAGSPVTRELTAGKQPVGSISGFLRGSFFYRRPVGPGFALIGDAGHFKDFVTGHGMTDAFLDAERMANAVLDDRDEAYALYWHQRDVETLPLHFDALRQGGLAFNQPFQRWIVDCIRAEPALKARLMQVFLRELSPAEVVPTPALLGFVARALTRGRFDVLPGFVRAGRELRAEARELARRQALLESAQRELAQAAPRGATSYASRAA